MPRSRRLAHLAILGLVAIVGCGDATSPPVDVDPDPDTEGPETVGPAGGTAAASDGAATLSVPAGALDEPVEITVTPAAVSDMLGLVPAEEYDPDLGTVFGVAPIAGTIWDLEPDGLQFAAPATIVLRYEESAIPEGTSEEDLAVFVVNGAFEELPSTVDTDANTVTAEVGHFSFLFTAPRPGARVDLELTDLSASTDPWVGQPVAYTAEVRNHGPGPASASRVFYVATGTIVLGPVHPSCTEVVDVPEGELALSCTVPPLSVGEHGSAAAIQIVPQQSGETVTVRATVVPDAEDNDVNPDNHTLQIGHSVGGEGALVDLWVAQPQIHPSSERRVGGLMEFVGRVDNRGVTTSNGGTLRIEATGDIQMGDVPGNCTEIEPVAPVAAVIECPVRPLEPHDVTGAGPLRITALSAGDVEVVVTVRPAPEDTDINPDNDVRRLVVPIAATFLVDLEPVSPIFIDGTRLPGSPLSARIRVGNYLPPSNGGTILYEALGDVVLGEVAEGCTATSIPSGVAVICAFDAFTTWVNDTTGPEGETIFGWVGPFEVIPQSDGIVTFAATTVPIEGDTDTRPENDRLERVVEIGDVPGDDRTVDLAIVSLSTSGAALVDEAVEIVAALRNLGPDASRGALVTFVVGGDVELGQLGASCIGGPLGNGFQGVECTVEPLTAENGRDVSLTVIPRSVGPVQIGAIVRALVREDRDPDPVNDNAELEVVVEPG